MNERTYQALKNVVAYFIEDEKEHWEASGKPSNHIYVDLQRIEEFIKSNPLNCIF